MESHVKPRGGPIGYMKLHHKASRFMSDIRTLEEQVSKLRAKGHAINAIISLFTKLKMEAYTVAKFLSRHDSVLVPLVAHVHHMCYLIEL